MLRSNSLTFTTDIRNTELAMEEDKDSVTGKECRRDELVKTKDFLKSIVSKRKLRLDTGAARPHSAPTSPAANVSVLDLTWDEDELRTVKKAKQDGSIVTAEEIDDRSGNKRMATKIRNILSEIDREVKAASEWAKERNTKKELKEGIQKLACLASQIRTHEVQALLQTLGRDTTQKGGLTPTSSEGIEVAKPEDERRIAELERANAILARENAKLKEEVRRLRYTENTVLDEDMLTDTDDYNQFLVVEKLNWPKGIYKSAFLAAGSPRTLSKDADLLVLHEEGNKKYNNEYNEELEKFFQDRYPELRDLEGRLSAITINTKVIKPGAITSGSDKWVIRAELDLDEGGRGWFDTLLTVRKLMVDGGRKKLVVYPPSPDAEGYITRKALEYIFRATGIKCLIHAKSQANDQRTRKTARRSTDALVLSQAGKSYSDLLKTLKATVKPGTTPARAIRTVRESKNGGMVVILDKDSTAIGELRNELNKISEVNIKSLTGNNDTALFIHDIDGLADKDEVVLSICEELNTTPEHVSVGELRKSYSGNQTTMVRLPHEKAEQLLTKGRVRIGLSWCPIKERVEVTRCFRCWKYGHLARDCKETADDSKLCRKCGGAGHLATRCDRADFCLTCKLDGHTAGSGGCPEFRKAIARERIKRKGRSQL